MKKTVRKKSVALLLSLALLLTTMPCVPTAAAEEIAVTPTSQTLTETTETHTLSTEQEETSASALTADCGILSYVDEEVFESGNHVLRLPEEETLSTYVFLNSNGTKTVYYMDENVKFVDSDGNIHEKDLTLTSMVGGYTTTQNDIQLSLPTDPANGISLTHNGYTVSLTPQGGTLSTPVQLSGNSICYPNYFAPASILVYTPTLSGLKEEIVLVKYAGVHTFSFLLNTDGLNLYQENGRYYLSESSSGQTRIDLGDLVTFDATGRFSVGTMTAETVIAGQTYRLSLEVDEEFLTDSNTTYPVTVDPEFNVRGDSTTSSAIEDATVFNGKSTLNTGTWIYGHCGYYDSTYGIGRIVVRLTGLLNHSKYQSMSADQITSVEFHIREASGSAASTINLYALTSNTTWTETGVTYDNYGSYDANTVYASAALSNNAMGCFDITNLVKAWKNGTLNGNAGFILIGFQENTLDKTLCLAECATESNRPYVKVTYEEVEGEVNITAPRNDVDRGGSLTLTAITSPCGQAVTWTSSNTAIASINENGLVSGYKAGTVTITAELENGNSDTFVVYVTVADGIYYIRNAATDYHLTSSTTLGMTAYSSINNLYTDYANQARQVWKIKYIDGGYYTVRPLYTVSGCLTAASNGYAIVQNNPNENTLPSVSTLARWRIDENSFGFAFKNLGSDARTLKPAEPSTAPGTNVIIGAWESTLKSHWTLEWLDRVYLRDEATGHPTTASTVKYMEVGEQKTYDALGFELETYGKQATLSWTSSNEEVATVSASGEISGWRSGQAIITLTSTLDGESYSQSFAIYVRIPNGTYMIRNRELYSYMQIDDNRYTDFSASEAIMELWPYSGASHQQWIITNLDGLYYSIRSVESGLALTVRSGYTDTGELALEQHGYTGADTQKWEIVASSSGAYVIRPKSAESLTTDWCMSAGMESGGDDGYNVEQKAYTEDADYMDEWLIGPIIDIGMSTDDCTAGCINKDRSSYRHANAFYDTLGAPSTKTHHYNRGLVNTASKDDFAENGAISNEIDFMIYIGHGHAAHDSSGNHLHYDCGRLGYPHENYGCISAGNLYTDEVKFGGYASDLRWIWLYTCNFLTTGTYVTDASLKEMMNGAHIIMGYGSQSYLCDPMAEAFAAFLRDGETIIDAFFAAGYYAESAYASDNHLQKILYIPQARYETIYSPPVDYESDASDVLIITHNIDEEYSID